MKLAVYEEMGELGRRMDDLMRSFFGPRVQFMRPAPPAVPPQAKSCGLPALGSGY
jgi:hypothetical protein